MNKIYNIFKLGIVLLFISLSFQRCNFLDIDNYFQGTFPEDSIFHSKANAEAYLWNTPKGFPNPGSIWGHSWNLGQMGSDEMMVPWLTGEFWSQQYTTEIINERNLPGHLRSQYKNMYIIIARCNKMLDVMKNKPPKNMSVIEIREYVSYVHFLRGYAYYHLLMNWGPILCLHDEILNTSSPAAYYDRERMTYDESIDYIVGEFEESLKGLKTSKQLSVAQFEKPNKTAALALIARLRLYQASPLFNGGEAARAVYGTWIRESDQKPYINQTLDPKRWAVAAAAAKQVIKSAEQSDIALHTIPLPEGEKVDKLLLNISAPKEMFPEGVGGIDPYRSYSEMFNGESIAQTNKEFIWVQPSSAISDHNRQCTPFNFGGWGGISVPKRVIDCYLMEDGTLPTEGNNGNLEKKLSNPLMRWGCEIASGSLEMYDKRSARFYASIGMPGRKWPMSSASASANYINKTFWYSIDDTDAGKNAASNNPEDYNRTGYTSVKWLHPDDSYAQNKDSQVKGTFIIPKFFPIIRYAEVLLEYVEALNYVEDGEVKVAVANLIGEKDTVSVTRDVSEMKKYFNMIRYRVGLPGPDQSKFENKEEFEKILRNERQVELFDEGYRWFDIRRWGIYHYIDGNSSNWQGFDTSRERTDANGNNAFWSYVNIDTRAIRERVSRKKMYFLPLNHDELLKVPKMSQNGGWDR